MQKIAPLTLACLTLALVAAPACDEDPSARPFVDDDRTAEFRPTWGSSSNGTARFNTARIGDHTFANVLLGVELDGVELEKVITSSGHSMASLDAPNGWLEGRAGGLVFTRADFLGSSWRFRLNGFLVRSKIVDYDELKFQDESGAVIYKYPVYTFKHNLADWNNYKNNYSNEVCWYQYQDCVDQKPEDECDEDYQECLDPDPHLCDEELWLDDKYPYPSGMYRAVFYEGWSVDTSTGKILGVAEGIDPDQLYIACISGAMGKSATWGHAAWVDPDADQLQAATRKVRADYCANGESYTEDGTPLLVQDQYWSFPGIPSIWEADWGWDGAYNVYNTRNGQPLGCATPAYAGATFALTDLPM